MDERTELVRDRSDREAVAVEQLRDRATSTLGALWRRMRFWYREDEVRALAQQSAALTEQARQVAGGLGAAYMQQVTTSSSRTGPGALRLPPARQGADLVRVYARPAEAYRRTFSTTEDKDAALDAALARLTLLIDADLMLARRDGEHQALTTLAPDAIGYRRIIHPERSIGGVCGLCVAASDRIYSLAELLPVHERCKCTIAEVTRDYDPGEANDVDLGELYDAAGSTSGADLKRTRWTVNEHGELGPVLTRAGDKFQSQDEAPKGDAIARARKELDALDPVLERLEERAAGGDRDADEPLEWQRARVQKLRDIAGAT